MSPTIALIFCVVFVLWLLRIERKEAPKVSGILWIPTIWMILIASKPLSIWFPSMGGDIDAGSTLDQFVFSGLLCLGLAILILRRFNWVGAIRDNGWLMLLVAYMLVSVLWSDIPFISFKRWVREVTALVMAFVVLTEPAPSLALESLFRRWIYMLIPFSLLLIKYFPYYGVSFGQWSGQQMWIGVTMQKNNLGRLCIISGFFLIWSLFRRWRSRNMRLGAYIEIFILVMALRLMMGPKGAYSATSIGAFCAALAVFAGLLWIKNTRKKLWANTVAVMMAFLIGLGVVTVFIGGSTLGDITTALGRDETLTGRTNIWARLLPAAMDKPVFGSGFGGFWTSATRKLYAISGGHSGYLDMLIGLGFFGLLLVSIFFLSSCRRAQRELGNDFDWASLWICYLLMTVISNVTETSLTTFTDQMTAILLFLAVSYPRLFPRNREFHEKGEGAC